jgi:hypothetical protein
VSLFDPVDGLPVHSRQLGESLLRELPCAPLCADAVS